MEDEPVRAAHELLRERLDPAVVAGLAGGDERIGAVQLYPDAARGPAGGGVEDVGGE